MSWLSGMTGPPAGPALPPLEQGSFHPVSKRYEADKLFGQLTAEDTSWLAQGSGFVTETQIFYTTLPNGRLVMCQVIHSGIGLWYPQIQFTFRYFDYNTKEHVWKSTNVTNFKTPPPVASNATVYDKRSCRADQFSVLLDPAKPDIYTVSGRYDDDVQVNFTFTRAPNVPGWKVGSDARGGLTYFGQPSGKASASPDLHASSDGYMVHRFLPLCSVAGSVVINGRAMDLEGGRGVFIHAIQGMRPNLIASRWNFANFHSFGEEGVGLLLMEFTTVGGANYGPPKKVAVGSVVVGDKLVAVTCGPSSVANTQAEAVHNPPMVKDPDTGGYAAPSSITFSWQGASLLANSDGTAVPTALPVSRAELQLPLAAEGCKDGNYVTDGLIEKVDVMAQIPYLVKKVIAAVAGARPYIYTWLNPVTATVDVPSQLVDGSEGSELKSLTVRGYAFNEATFISE